MAEGTDKNDEVVKTEREEIFSKSVRAGKRTYFFDVKTTRRNDYYLTLTESKKRFNRDGRFYFEKHKIFLYKEDFDKFIEGLTETISYIKENAPEMLDPIEPETADTETLENETKELTGAEAPAEEVVADDSAKIEKDAEASVQEEVSEPITEDFSNVEFEDLEDKKEG